MKLKDRRERRMRAFMWRVPEKPVWQKPKVHELGTFSVKQWYDRYAYQNTRCMDCIEKATTRRRMMKAPNELVLICYRCCYRRLDRDPNASSALRREQLYAKVMSEHAVQYPKKRKLAPHKQALATFKAARAELEQRRVREQQERPTESLAE